ncbi:MAG: DUF1361 domain-containing protein [Crocinitomicaceae bacterium]|nr:DUF1361 domain-containing protein [Crocinitomicaceae bacterium]
MKLAGNNYYLFLNWNLFLAFLPLLFTSMLYGRYSFVKTNVFRVGVVGVWLLFFPNAPYILTDLFHLKHYSSIPIWFDLILILGYAWTGLMAGFLSLRDVELHIFKHLDIKKRVLMSMILLFITAFGIYLGRYLRFNSWDLLQRPETLLFDIVDRFIHPFSHKRTWGMTIGMGVLLNLMYWSPRVLFTEKVD